MCTRNSCNCGRGNGCPVAYPTFPGSLVGPTGPEGPEGDGYVLSSSTPLVFPLALGSQALTVDKTDSDSAYSVGSRIRVADPSNPTVDYFEGVITAYSGTTLTLTIDYAPGTSVVPIAVWNISITGDVGTVVGFDDLPWVEYTVTTAQNTAPPYTGDICSNSTANVFEILTATGVIRYKKLGKTILLSFYVNGTMIVSTASSTGIAVIFYIKIPTTILTPVNSQFDSGSAFLVPGSQNILSPIGIENKVYPNTLLTNDGGNTGYLSTQNFSMITGTVGPYDTNGIFLINGSITFEVQ